MRLVTFARAGQDPPAARVGVLVDDTVVDVFAAHYAKERRRGTGTVEAHRAAAARAPRDMVALFEAGADGLRAADEAAAFAVSGAATDAVGAAGENVRSDVDEVRLLAPVPRPRRVRDYLTYRAHASGSGLAVPEAFAHMPICYKCNVETIVGPGDPLLWPAYTDQLDFELEIGFFTSRGGRNLSVEEAQTRIAGVTLFNDVSARDVQGYEMTMTIGPSKGKDFCTAMGPCVLTMDEVDEFDIRCAVRVNGEEWASGSTADRQFSFAEVLAWASYSEDVYPGEFLALGTVGGGCGLELDRWIKPGDVVELEAGGIGVLSNPVGAKEQVPAGSGIPSYTGSPRMKAGH